MTYLIIYIIGVVVMAALIAIASKVCDDPIEKMIPAVIVACLASWVSIISVLVIRVLLEFKKRRNER